MINQCSQVKHRALTNILCCLVALPGMVLLLNSYPYFAISTFSILLLLAIIFIISKKKVASYHVKILFILSSIFIYFILSYFISRQTIHDFFSYKFLRYDGNFFFNYIPFFALAIPYFDYKKVSMFFFHYIFFSFSVSSIIGIVEFFTKKFTLFFGIQNKEDVFLVFNNTHNATGSVYAVACIFLLAFFLLENVWKIKIFYLLGLMLCVVGLLLTKSRGGYLGFIAGAIMVFWLYHKSIYKFLLTVAAMITALIPIVFLTGSFDRVKMIFDFSERNIQIRFKLWEKAIYLFTQSPIFGIGFGRYNDIKLNTFSNVTNQSLKLMGKPGIAAFYVDETYSFSFAHAHNSYLQFLAETGIVGLALLLAFWIICLRIILKGYNLTKDNKAKTIYLCAAGGIITLFILSITENYFSATTLMICLSMAVSLAIGLRSQEDAGNLI